MLPSRRDYRNSSGRGLEGHSIFFEFLAGVGRRISTLSECPNRITVTMVATRKTSACAAAPLTPLGLLRREELKFIIPTTYA